MDRATFDRERSAVQDELRNAGQDIEIPDPESPDYFSTFLVLQRTHPRLAARLAQAEQADPPEFLDPYTPRPPKITAKHRWNSFVEKYFMRRGIDRKLVLDRQRVFKTGVYTLGGVVVAGLVWSVVAPKPTVAADPAVTPASQIVGESAAVPSTETSGAFTTGSEGAVAGEPGEGTEAGRISPAPRREENTFAASTPDAAPQPVTSDSGTASTPPPPAVFNQVAPNDPYVPVAATPAPPPVAIPVPEPTPYEDSAPAPIAVPPAATPVVRSAPFGGVEPQAEPMPVSETRFASVPVPVGMADPPIELSSPFASAPAPEAAPAPQGRADPTPESTVPAQPEASPPFSAPTASSSPFGGESANPVVSPSTSVPLSPVPEDQPARGAAMIYQAPRQAEPLPKSSLVYQRPAQQTPPPASALIYKAQSSAETAATTGSSLTYQRRATVPAKAEPAAVAGTEAQPAISSTTGLGAAPAADPDAPRFAPTAVIQGKLFSNIRTAAGLAVPVIVVSKDGNWVGLASYNTALGRVDMRFTSFVLNKNGKSYPVEASAYQAGKGGTISEGVAANIHPIAPTLAVDIARAGMNSLNTYTQALQNSGTTSVSGSLLTTTRQAPALVQVVRGEIGKVFALPEGNLSIRIVADVAAGTEVHVVYGVSGIPAEQERGQLP